MHVCDYFAASTLQVVGKVLFSFEYFLGSNQCMCVFPPLASHLRTVVPSSLLTQGVPQFSLVL